MRTRPIAERFAEKVDTDTSSIVRLEQRCHEWRGTLMPNGYGQVHHKQCTQYAHRIAWELANGPIPPGLFVLHRCDNRKCVNPAHLFLGTFGDNMRDMVDKRRQAHGTRNFHAKLSPDIVREIRRTSGTHRSIAERFGVTQSLVSMIRNRRIWRNVEMR